MEVINNVMGRVATDFIAVATTPAAVAATAEAAQAQCTAHAYDGLFADWPPDWLKNWSWQPLLPWNWSFQIDWTLLIDAFGLTLAIIGLFNLGPRLQAWSEIVIRYARYHERYMLYDLRALWPLTHSWWFLMKEGCQEFLEWFWIVPFSFWAGGEWGMFWGFVKQFSPWQLLGLLALYPAVAMLMWLVIRILSIVSSMMLATTIWRMCLVLNYPPAGVLGAIGLLITFASIVVNRL